MQSKYPECGIKKPRFVKEQEAKRLLSNSGVKTPLRKIPLLNVLRCVKMNEIVNRFLLVGDKFNPQMYLKEPGFTYGVLWSFHKKQIKN